MQSAGKLLLFFLLSGLLFAEVHLEINPKVIQAGDRVTITLSSDQEDTIFPRLTEIGGYPVIASPTENRLKIINNRQHIYLSRSYVIAPLGNLTLPSFEVQYGGNSIYTKPETITVKKRTKTKSQYFDFSIEMDKTTAYVGEPLTLTLRFTINGTIQLQNLNINLENIPNLWFKPLGDQWEGIRKAEKTEYTLRYRVYPQTAGTLNLPHQPVIASTLINDRFSIFQNVKNHTIFSNDLTLEIKPLPKGVAFNGQYALDVTVDTLKVQAGKPVNLTATLEGEGSLEGIEPFNLTIPNVTVYQDEPTITIDETGKSPRSKAIFKYALVADSDYEIPAFEFLFFDPKQERTLKERSQPIDIQVQNTSKTTPNTPQIKTATPAQNTTSTPPTQTSIYLPWIMLLLGVMIGMALIRFTQRNTRPKAPIKRHHLPLIEQIKKASDTKALIATLLPHIDDPQIEEILRTIEAENPDKKRLKQFKTLLIELFRESDR